MRSKVLRFVAGLTMFAICFAFSGWAQADTITFDPAATGEGNDVSQTFTVLGSIDVTFDNAIYVKAGDTGNDDPKGFRTNILNPDLSDQTSGTGTSFDNDNNWFISDKIHASGNVWKDPGTDVKINFSSAVRQVSFDIADLDAPNGTRETLTASAWSESSGGGIKLAENYILGRNPDNVVRTVSFDTPGIRSLVIDVDRPGGSFGFGIDNVAVVPAPGAVAGLASMALMGLVGVGLRRFRCREEA